MQIAHSPSCPSQDHNTLSFTLARFDSDFSSNQNHLLPSSTQKFYTCYVTIAEKTNIKAKCCFFPTWEENLVTAEAVSLFSLHQEPCMIHCFDSKTMGEQISTSTTQVSALFQVDQEQNTQKHFAFTATADIVPGPLPEGAHFLFGGQFMREYGVKFDPEGKFILSEDKARSGRILTASCKGDRLEQFGVDGSCFQRFFAQQSATPD